MLQKSFWQLRKRHVKSKERTLNVLLKTCIIPFLQGSKNTSYFQKMALAHTHSVSHWFCRDCTSSLQPGTTITTTYGQGCTTTYGQGCTSTLVCPGPNACSSLCCGRPSCSTQTTWYVCPDGDYRRWSCGGLCSRTHHWPRHDWRLRWRTLGACQTWRHVPGK